MRESQVKGADSAVASTGSNTATGSKLTAFLAHWPKWVPYLAIALLIGLLVAVAIPAYKLLGQFNDAVEVLTDRYGINTFLAKAIATGLLVPLAVGAKRGFASQKRSFGARVFTGLYGGAYFLVMYGVSRNASFSHKTGEALQYCAQTPEGLRCFDSPGFDPKYGIELQPVTPEMKQQVERRRLGQLPHTVPLEEFPQLQLFDPISGEPKYWYYRAPSGDIELFDAPGIHPRTQEPLRVVDSAVVPEIKAWLDAKAESAIRQARQARQNRYLDMAVTRSPGIRQWAVLVADSNNTLSESLIGAAREALTSKGLRTVLLFRQAFLDDGLSRRLYDGDPSALQGLSVDRFCDGVIVGRLQVRIERSDDPQGLVTARGTMGVKLIKVASSASTESFQLSALGAGFSSDAAQAQLFGRLGRDLKTRLQGIFQ